MCKPIWDMTDGEPLFGGSGGLAFNSDGDMLMRVSDSMAIDMDSGELHLTAGWGGSSDEED